MPTVMSKCFPDWRIEQNYLYNPQGKIWVWLSPSIGSVSCIYKDDQSISLEVVKAIVLKYCVTTVYASTYSQQRRCLWNYIVNLACNMSTPWMVLGDFNSILNSQEQVGEQK